MLPSGDRPVDCNENDEVAPPLPAQEDDSRREHDVQNQQPDSKQSDDIPGSESDIVSCSSDYDHRIVIAGMEELTSESSAPESRGSAGDELISFARSLKGSSAGNDSIVADDEDVDQDVEDVAIALHRVIIHNVSGHVFHLEPRIIGGTIVHFAFDSENRAYHHVVAPLRNDHFVEGIFDSGGHFHPVIALSEHALRTGSGMGYCVSISQNPRLPYPIRLCLQPPQRYQFVPSPFVNLPATLVATVSPDNQTQINMAIRELEAMRCGVHPLDIDTIRIRATNTIYKALRELMSSNALLPPNPAIPPPPLQQSHRDDFVVEIQPAHRAKVFQLEMGLVSTVRRANPPPESLPSAQPPPAHQSQPVTLKERQFPAIIIPQEISQVPQLIERVLGRPTHHIAPWFTHRDIMVEFIHRYLSSDEFRARSVNRVKQEDPDSYAVHLDSRDLTIVALMMLSPFIRVHTALVPFQIPIIQRRRNEGQLWDPVPLATPEHNTTPTPVLMFRPSNGGDIADLSWQWEETAIIHRRRQEVTVRLEFENGNDAVCDDVKDAMCGDDVMDTMRGGGGGSDNFHENASESPSTSSACGSGRDGQRKMNLKQKRKSCDQNKNQNDTVVKKPKKDSNDKHKSKIGEAAKNPSEEKRQETNDTLALKNNDELNNRALFQLEKLLDKNVNGGRPKGLLTNYLIHQYVNDPDETETISADEDESEFLLDDIEEMDETQNDVENENENESVRVRSLTELPREISDNLNAPVDNVSSFQNNVEAEDESVISQTELPSCSREMGDDVTATKEVGSSQVEAQNDVEEVGDDVSPELMQNNSSGSGRSKESQSSESNEYGLTLVFDVGTGKIIPAAAELDGYGGDIEPKLDPLLHEFRYKCGSCTNWHVAVVTSKQLRNTLVNGALFDTSVAEAEERSGHSFNSRQIVTRSKCTCVVCDENYSDDECGADARNDENRDVSDNLNEQDEQQNQWIAIAQDVSVSTSAIVPSHPPPPTQASHHQQEGGEWGGGGDEVDGDALLFHRPADTPSTADFDKFRSLDFQLRFENLFATSPDNLVSPLPKFNWANSKDVWRNMVKKEMTFQRDPGMFRNHPELQPRMRSILLDWLSEVCEVYRLHKETFTLCIDFIDRYLSVTRDVAKTQLQLTGISSLFIAAKLEEIYPPKLHEFAYVTDSACSEADIVRQEMIMLKALKWDLSPMTTNAWLGIYLQMANLEHIKDAEVGFVFPQFSSHAFIQISRLCDLCLMDSGSYKFRYSVLAAAALYHHTNEQLVQEVSSLNWADLYPCIKWMAPFAKAILEVGQSPTKFFPHINAEDCHNIQTHNVDMQLVDRAQVLQASFLEKEKLCPSSMDISAQLVCLLTPETSANNTRMAGCEDGSQLLSDNNNGGTSPDHSRNGS